MLWVSLWKLWMTETGKQKQSFAGARLEVATEAYEILRV